METIIKLLQELKPETDFNSNDFIHEGLLDSFDLLNLITKIEDEFSITINGEDILPEHFKNVESIYFLIKKYRGDTQ